jgi:hypothetical protein
MRIHVLCLALVLASLTINSAGCLIVAAGAGAAGTVAYMRGDLEMEEACKLEVVYTATREAMKQLELPVLEGKTEKDALSATIVARDASDKRITVKLKAQGEQTTKISIRIGTFGDQTKSQMIYNRIREKLKAAGPQPAHLPPQPSVAPPPTNPVVSAPPAPAMPGSPDPQQAAPVPLGPAAAAPAPTVTSPPAPE